MYVIQHFADGSGILQEARRTVGKAVFYQTNKTEKAFNVKGKYCKSIWKIKTREICASAWEVNDNTFQFEKQKFITVCLTLHKKVKNQDKSVLSAKLTDPIQLKVGQKQSHYWKVFLFTSQTHAQISLVVIF